MNKFIKFHLNDLPIDEFCVLLETKAQKRLIEEAAKKLSKRNHGKYIDLANHLKKKCRSFSKIRVKAISDVYISKWKKHKKFIPIDCVIELCKLNNISIKEIETKIIRLKYKISANRNAISFNFLYDIPFATIAEIIKTEGHMKRNFSQCSIGSQNIEFINYVKHLIRKIGVPSHNFYEYIRIEFNVPHSGVQKIIDSNSKELPFTIRHRKKTVCFYDITLNIGERKKYKVILNDGEIINLSVEIPQNSKIIGQSSYKKCGAISCLTITNMTFVKILSILVNVPVGKKSKIIKFCQKIHDSPTEVKRSVIGAIFACEGWVEVKYRRIRFFVESESYIKYLKKLLEDFDIFPTINNRKYLSVTSRNDLIKFSKKFDFIIKEKTNKLSEIIASYKNIIFRHNEGMFKTLELVKNEKLTAYQISNLLNKHKDSIFSYLNRGIKNGYINVDKNKQPYKYFITSKGLNLVGDKIDIIGNRRNST